VVVVDLEQETLATLVNRVDQVVVGVDMEQLPEVWEILLQYPRHKETMEDALIVNLLRAPEVLEVVAHQLQEVTVVLVLVAVVQVLQYLGCQVLEFIHCYQDQYKLQ